MHPTTISGLFAVLFYLLGCIYQSRSIIGRNVSRNTVLLFGLLAVLAHAFSASGVIKTINGYHFGIAAISTLVCVSISALVLASCLRKPMENLFLGLFPLAIISIVVSLTVSSSYAPISLNLGMASHILMSILAASFLAIAALQAVFLAFQNHQLKHKQLVGIIRRFPPLQDMETLLFELLWAGQILLTLGIISGFIFNDDIWLERGIYHTVFFLMLAWVVFGTLLWGRHVKGWRGKTAIRGTLIGFSFILVGYYGSRIVLEYIIQ